MLTEPRICKGCHRVKFGVHTCSRVDHAFKTCPESGGACCICLGHDHAGMPVEYVGAGSPELSRHERGLPGPDDHEPERLPIPAAARSPQLANFERALSDLIDAIPTAHSGLAEASLARARIYLRAAHHSAKGAALCERAHERLDATEAGEG